MINIKSVTNRVYSCFSEELWGAFCMHEIASWGMTGGSGCDQGWKWKCLSCLYLSTFEQQNDKNECCVSDIIRRVSGEVRKDNELPCSFSDLLVTLQKTHHCQGLGCILFWCFSLEAGDSLTFLIFMVKSASSGSPKGHCIQRHKYWEGLPRWHQPMQETWVGGLVPGLGRPPEEGNGNPLWYSCLENPVDRGVWWATVRGVTLSQTHLKWLSTCHTENLNWLLQVY